jgi:4-hydroxyproline epimerase
MTQHTFSCLDGHTCGNPVRLVTGGGPLLKGATMSERRLDFLANHDWIRKALMFEPRGHDVMSGSILYPPTRASMCRAACRCAAMARSAPSPWRSRTAS